MRSGAAGEHLDVTFHDRDLPAEVRTLTSSFQHLMRSISVPCANFKVSKVPSGEFASWFFRIAHPFFQFAT